MKNLIQKTVGFKIVPEKFRSSTTFEVQDCQDEYFTAKLDQIDEVNMDDYVLDQEVEVFGLGDDGLIYFISQVIGKDNNILKLKYPAAYKNIQRREYSRVAYNGIISIKELPDAKIEPVDLSAGGIRFYTNQHFEKDKTYQISIELKNNIIINCNIKVLRTFETLDNKQDVRAEFMNLSDTDRVAIIQYSFQIMLENENK